MKRKVTKKALQRVFGAKAVKACSSSRAEHWAQCFLEHAARETAWMAQHGKNCDYAAAHEASVRRGVWLHAALLAQEKKPVA